MCDAIEQRINSETSNKLVLPGSIEIEKDIVPLGILILGSFVILTVFCWAVGFAAHYYISRTVYQDAVNDIDAIVTGY